MNRTWPKLVISGYHHFGLLKTDVQNQGLKRAKDFNDRISEFVRPEGVAFLDYFSLTKGVYSTDGTHFGMGANMWKAKILLNYLLELRTKGFW